MLGASTWLACTALAGCRRGSDPDQVPQAVQPVVVDVVARVGDRAIGGSEVAARMVAEELDAKAALEQLVNEALLLREAERSALMMDRDDQRGVERLMVRAMLHNLEGSNTPESISDEEVREAYEVNAREFEVRERRGSWHILVESQSEEAQGLAESILRELKRADDPRVVYERYAGEQAEQLAFGIKAEDLPPVNQSAGLEKSYKTAIFEAESEGPLKSVVKTSYGWHAIVVSEILPAEKRTLEDAEEEIRERLSQRRRLGTVVQIVQELEGQGLVQYDEQGVQSLLSMSGLPERVE